MNDTVVLAKLSRGSLYYYKGNFYHPIERLTPNDRNLIKLHKRKFTISNKETIKQHRSDSSYKTVLELFDKQMTAT